MFLDFLQPQDCFSLKHYRQLYIVYLKDHKSLSLTLGITKPNLQKRLVASATKWS